MGPLAPPALPAFLPAVAPFLPARLLPRLQPEVAALARGAAVAVAHLHGAVIFLDVKGYSALASELVKLHEASASEELINVLNGYLGPVIGELHRHGAEVLAFAGDAMLAIIPAESSARDAVAAAAERAAAAALAVRAVASASPAAKAAGGTTLLLHQGIGVGEVLVYVLRAGPSDAQLAYAGDAIRQVSSAVASSKMDEIVVAPEGAHYLDGRCETAPLPAERGMGRVVKRAPGGQPRPAADLPGRCACGAGPLPPAEAAAARAMAEGCRDALLSLAPVTVRKYDSESAELWSWSLNHCFVIFASFPELDLSAPLHAMRRRLASEDAATGTTPHAARLGQIVEIAHEVASRWKGTLYKVLFDDKGATLILAWGLPGMTVPDLSIGAERAARAALDLEEQFGGAAGAPFAAGLASGRTFCGSLGSTCRKEYALIGSALNMAARLMDLAWKPRPATPGSDPSAPRPGAVLCDETIMTALDRPEASVLVESWGAVELKGWSEPVSVYWPRAAPPEGAPTTRGGQTARRLSLSTRRMSLGPPGRRASLSPLPPRVSLGMPSLQLDLASEVSADEELCIGREGEIARLAAALDAAVARGLGSTFLIEGEAGIGKSTLVSRASAMVRERGGVVLTGFCNSIEGSVPLWPLRGVVASCADVSSLAALEESLAQLGAGTAHEAAILWRALFNQETRRSVIGRAGSGPAGGGQVELRNLADILANLLRALTRPGRPLALLIEDCQQCDRGTWVVLRRLRIACPPGIFVLTLRAEEGRPPEIGGVCPAAGPWPPPGAVPTGDERSVREGDLAAQLVPSAVISLQPLPRPDALRLVETLAAHVRADLPPVALLELVSKADGNPLFLSELFRQRVDLEAALSLDPGLGSATTRRRPSVGPGGDYGLRPSAGPSTDPSRRPSVGFGAETRRASLGMSSLDVPHNGSATTRQRPSTSKAPQALPQTIEQLLLARLDKLPVLLQGVARLASVAGIGRAFSLEAVRVADPTALDVEKLQGALTGLCAEHILRPANQSVASHLSQAGARAMSIAREEEGLYVFVHALWQESIYDATPMGQRRAAHGAIARWLEARTAEGRTRKETGLVALHWLAADEAVRALPFLLQVAGAALESQQLREATGMYAGVADLIDALGLAGPPAPDGGVERPPLAGRDRALSLPAAFRDALDAARRRAASGPPPTPDPDECERWRRVRARALRLWAHGELSDGRYSRAEAIVERVALPATPALAGRARLERDLRLGGLFPQLRLASRLARGLSRSGRVAVEGPPREGEESERTTEMEAGEALLDLARSRTVCGQLRLAAAALVHGLELLPPPDAPPRLALHARLRAGLAIVYAADGKRRRAGELMAWAERSAERVQDRRVESAVAFARALQALHAGRLEEAVRAGDRAAALAEGVDLASMWQSGCIAASCACTLGRFDEAQARAERLRSSGEKSGVRGFFTVAGVLTAVAFARDDDEKLDEAAELAATMSAEHEGAVQWWGQAVAEAAAGLRAWRRQEDLAGMADAVRNMLALWKANLAASPFVVFGLFLYWLVADFALRAALCTRRYGGRGAAPRGPGLLCCGGRPRVQAAPDAPDAPGSPPSPHSGPASPGKGEREAWVPLAPSEADALRAEAERLLRGAARRGSPPFRAVRALLRAQARASPAALAKAEAECERAGLPFFAALAARSRGRAAGDAEATRGAEGRLAELGVAPGAFRAHDRLWPL